MQSVKIVRRPIGEAPDQIRDAWIGLLLPLAHERRRTWKGVGVLSGPHNLILQLWTRARGKGLNVDGYAVDAKSAVDILAVQHPEAAGWWREHAPSLLDGKRWFVFDAEACERQP
jgi:hypothetical protein